MSQQPRVAPDYTGFAAALAAEAKVDAEILRNLGAGSAGEAHRTFKDTLYNTVIAPYRQDALTPLVEPTVDED